MVTSEQVSTDNAADQGGSYVQSLLGTAGDLGASETADTGAPKETAAEKPAATEAVDAAATTEKKAPEAGKQAPTVDELIQQFATETGLDPNDPNSRKTLKRLADKELFILKLQSDNESIKATAGQPAQELVTDFERELRAEATARPAEPGETKPAEVARTTEAQPFRYGDAGDNWKTPEDSLTALNEAWANNDLGKAHEIEVARLRRNFDSVIAPHLLKHIERMLETRMKGFVEKDLGDVVPEVRRTINDRRVEEARDFAVEQLRKAGADEIDNLFVTEQGPPIEFQGQQFPNTPLNRILAKHPEIMRVVESHLDPVKAERMTFVSRYKLAYQIHKQQGATAGMAPQTAQALVKAGREAGERKPQDRARQGLNAGAGATGVGTDKTASKSYVSDLNNLPGEVPFSSLV